MSVAGTDGQMGLIDLLSYILVVQTLSLLTSFFSLCGSFTNVKQRHSLGRPSLPVSLGMFVHVSVFACVSLSVYVLVDIAEGLLCLYVLERLRKCHSNSRWYNVTRFFFYLVTRSHHFTQTRVDG